MRAAQADTKEYVKKKSLWGDAWERLRRNRLAMFGLFIVVFFIFLAIFADVIAPYHYDLQHYAAALQGPSKAHWFGTDNFGRDILSRIIYGSRASLFVGALAVMISAIVGGVLGTVAGYYGGIIDNVIMRFIDILLAIPATLLAIAIAATLGPGIVNTTIAIGISNIGRFTRTTRAAVLSVR